MKIIDNSGRGNCMYYAYSISLMYYLRQQDDITRDEIFKKLQLTEDNIAELNKLIVGKKGVISQFTLPETKTVERIIGSACRALAGDNTQKEFLADPAGSSTFAASAFGIARTLKANLKPEYARLITLPSAAENFTKAEIFKVQNINAAMNKFSKNIVNEVENRMGLCAEDSKNELTAEKIMEEIIQEQTIAFFMNNDKVQLNKYINHLKRDTVWGSEETLLSLHRAITGEKRILNEWVHDTQTQLLILKDGRVEAWDKPENTDIILNNRGNSHWVSSIPQKFLVPTSKIEALVKFKTALEKIIRRFHDLSSQVPEAEAAQFAEMLQQKIKELDNLVTHYSNEAMNSFIHDLTAKLAPENPVFNSFNRKYFSEHIYNFINTGWHYIKIAFAALIYIVHPDMLKRLQVNGAVQYGLNTDIKTARALFGHFKPVVQIKEVSKVNQPLQDPASVVPASAAI